MEYVETSYYSAAYAGASKMLSAVEIKNSTFVNDSNFRQSWTDASSVLGAGAFARLQASALVVLKPEAFAGCRGLRIIDFITEHKFLPIASCWINLSRVSINTVWQYQWNVATNDRLDLAKHLYCADRALVVLLQDTALEPGLPGAVRFRKLKGAAQVEKRSPVDLRSVVDAPNRTMSLVHASDEPIDIVRELGIICERDDRRELYRSLARQTDGAYLAELRRIVREEDLSKGSYDLSGVTAGQKICSETDRYLNELFGLQSAVGDIAPHVDDALEYLALNEPGLEFWDQLILLSGYVCHDVASRECLIDFDGVAEWESGLGHLVV